MKTIIVSILALCLSMTLLAQEDVSNPQPEEGNHKVQTSNFKVQRNKAAYLELLGGSTMVGVNYDQRFSDHTRWGFRAGLSFAYSDNSGFYGGGFNCRYWAVPVGVNYLIGSKKNNLELGLGASLGVVNSHGQEWSMYSEEITQEEYERYLNNPSLLPANTSLFQNYDDNKCFVNYVDSRQVKDNSFGYYFFGDIGYRHTANSGFLFRVGLNPCLNFGDNHAISRTFGDTFRKFSMVFYLGFGWAW